MSSEQWATRYTVAVNHILSSTLFIRLQTTIYSFSFFCSVKYSRTYRNRFISHFNAARTIATCHYPIILSIIYAHSRALCLTTTNAFRMQNGQTNWVRSMLFSSWWHRMRTYLIRPTSNWIATERMYFNYDRCIREAFRSNAKGRITVWWCQCSITKLKIFRIFMFNNR